MFPLNGRQIYCLIKWNIYIWFLEIYIWLKFSLYLSIFYLENEIKHSKNSWLFVSHIRSSGDLLWTHLKSELSYEFLCPFYFILNRLIGWVGRVFINSPGDLGSTPGRIIPKTLKMVLDTSLLNTQQYKVL